MRPPPLRLGLRAGLIILLLVPFALLAIFVAASWTPLRSLDTLISESVHLWAVRHPAVVEAMRVWSLVFSPMVLRAAALVLAIWLFRRHKPRLGWWVIAVMAAGGIVAAVLKLLVERDRPEFLDPVARAAGYSFPSGHAANAALTSAVFLFVLLPYARRTGSLWTAAGIVTVVTGLSRIGLGVHYTSDVVAGWLLGVAVVVLSIRRSTWVRTRRVRDVASAETSGPADRGVAARDDRDRPSGDEGAVPPLAVHDRGRRQP